MLKTEKINLEDLGNLGDLIKSLIGNGDNIEIYYLTEEDTEKKENKELEDKRIKELEKLKICLDKLESHKNQIEKEIKKVFEDITSFDLYLESNKTRTVVSDYYLLLHKHLKFIEERLNFTEKNWIKLCYNKLYQSSEPYFL